jgi:hypothetical protein
MYVRIYTANDVATPWYVTWIHPLLCRRVKVPIDQPTAQAWAAEQVFSRVPNIYASIDDQGAHPYLTTKANLDLLPPAPAWPPAPSAGNAPTHFVGTVDLEAA